MLVKVAAAVAIAIALFLMPKESAVPSDQSIINRVVMLQGKDYNCSAFQVKAPSGKSYLLSAAHCSKSAINGIMTVVLEDGSKVARKVIREDNFADLLIIEGIEGMQGLEVARNARRHDHIRSYGHGNSLPTYRLDGIIITDKKGPGPDFLVKDAESMKKCRDKHGKLQIELDHVNRIIVMVCEMQVVSMITTIRFAPGCSGGPVVNDLGQVVGLASMVDPFFGYSVTLYDIQRVLEPL